MRIVLLVIPVMLCICSNAQSPVVTSTGKISEISGKIINYQPSENNRLLTIRIFTPVATMDEAATGIKADGSFNIQFTQHFTGNIDIWFDRKIIPLYFVAGEKATLQIDYKKLVEEENKANSVIMSGEGGKVSALIQDYKYHYSKQDWKTAIVWDDTTKTDMEVVDQRLNKMNEELDFLNKYIKQKNIDNPTFTNWAKNEIMYEAGRECAFEIQGSLRNRRFTFAELYHLLKTLPVDNVSALDNNFYYAYLESFAGNLHLAYRLRPVYENLRKQTDHDAIGYLIPRIDSIATGYARQLMYFKIFNENIKQSGFYRDKFQEVVTDDFLSKTFADRQSSVNARFKEYNLLDKLKAYPIDTTVKIRLIKLLESEKGNFVYMDFWGNWCEPCMQEMPYYPDLIERFKGKKISFLFMGVRTPEKEALAIKKKYGINGKFITLNGTESDLMRTLLDFQGYPSYRFLRPGSIVTSYGGDRLLLSGVKKLNPGNIKKLESFFNSTQ